MLHYGQNEILLFQNTHSHQGKQANPKDSEQIYPLVKKAQKRCSKVIGADFSYLTLR